MWLVKLSSKIADIIIHANKTDTLRLPKHTNAEHPFLGSVSNFRLG